MIFVLLHFVQEQMYFSTCQTPYWSMFQGKNTPRFESFSQLKIVTLLKKNSSFSRSPLREVILWPKQLLAQESKWYNSTVKKIRYKVEILKREPSIIHLKTPERNGRRFDIRTVA